MSHEVETMAWAGETPWHGLGVRVNNDLTPDQMMRAANVDWDVIEVPLVGNHNGQVINSGKKALIRSTDNRLLTVTSDDWHPNQNSEAFKFFTEFVESGDMEMHTAGSLFDGEIVWALAKVNESFSLYKGQDQVDSYLLFTNPHVYGRAIDVRFTPIRVVCNNTLTLSLGQKVDNMVRLNHRRKFDADSVKQTMKIASTKMSKYKEMAEFLSKKKYTGENLVEYFSTVYPSSSKKEEKLSRAAQLCTDVIETQPGHEFGKGTWWQAFNATTFVADHMLGQRPETRLSSAWYGVNKDRKLVALEKAVEYAEAA